MENALQKNIDDFSALFGVPKKRELILDEIYSSSLVDEWNNFSDEDKEKIILFLEGKQGIQILADKFFRHVFKPEDVPERIEALISVILGGPVKIERVLSREGSAITENGGQVIMDIIVKTDSGSIVNVEMQRIGYYFPGERSGCYTADMIMRQYDATRSEKGKEFSYRDLKPVVLIVIMEKSSKEFLKVAPEYFHRKISMFSSGAKITNLENVVYISLDTFKEHRHNEIESELEAWLSFFTYEKPEDIVSLVNSHPEFIPLYQDIAKFRNNPKEVVGMFSEALRIMDRNTTKYMIEDMKREAEELAAERDALAEELAAQRNALEELEEITSKRDALASERDTLAFERDEAIRKNKELEALLKANGIAVPK